MINLRLKACFENKESLPFVAKLSKTEPSFVDDSATIAYYLEQSDESIAATSSKGAFSFIPPNGDEFDGDIVMCFPAKGRIDRLFRANSTYNTLLITEQCDQMCLMCSQPPRNTNDAWRFEFYEEAILLLPQGSTITLSGGEPTLYKDHLLTMLENVSKQRPDIRFHILSNAQHWKDSDIPRLKSIHNKIDILWGIPLYADKHDIHDKIVDKNGAFNQLLKNLYILGASQACIELRTVVTALNALELPNLAKFISEHLDFISYWAVMAMEPVGFAKANLNRLIYDHSVAPQPIHKTIDIAAARDIDIRLFNFPLCTVGTRYRKFCHVSISDWKRKYLSECSSCEMMSECTGFFEWYNEDSKWELIEAIEGT